MQPWRASGALPHPTISMRRLPEALATLHASGSAMRAVGGGSLRSRARGALSLGRPLSAFVALLLIVFLLLALMYAALAVNQGIRGYSAAESEWSKGRKEAVHQLERYLRTGAPEAWDRYVAGLTVPLALRKARLEMERSDYRPTLAVNYMVGAGSHPDDAALMALLFRWFGWQPIVADAIRIWTEADAYIVALEQLGRSVRVGRLSGELAADDVDRMLADLDRIDLAVLPLEIAFSARLGEAARLTKLMLAMILLVASLLLLGLGAYIVRRVTARVFMARTFEAEERFRKTFEVAPVGIAHIGLDGRWTDVNDSLCRMLGYEREALIGCHEADLLAHGFHQTWDKSVPLNYSGSADTMHGERSYRRSDGHTVILQLHVTTVRNLYGEALNYVAIAHDVTESRRMARELSFRARHDLLTGLLNRYEFERIVKDLAEDADAERVPAMLLYLDLDQFKVVNDSCGHMAGDAMLTELAALIRGCLRSGDTLARLGGDEFGVLLQHCPPTKAETIAEKIRSEVAAFRFHWGERSFNLGVSIGIVPFVPGEYEGARLLSVADYACYAAKEAGRNQLHLARPEDANTVRHHEEMNWLGRLQDAHDEDRFFLVWQPIVPVHHAPGTPPRHFEVLLRLRERDGSVSMPGTFLSAAERYGKVIELDTWVVSSLMQWLNDHVECADLIDQLNVNVSGAAVSDPRYIECVTALITQSRFPADRLCFEITETMAISNIGAATAFMKRLSEYGCRFALDDFGIGSSSFAYLNALPVDFVKIDGAFVHDLDRDAVHESITRCIIDVAHSMGKATVAEFVESDAVRRRLQMLGCGYAQGFGIGAATPLGDFSLRPTGPARPVLVDTAQRMAV